MKFSLAGLAFFFSVLCSAQSAKEILQTYFDTVSNGEIRNWDKIRSVYIESVAFYNSQQADASQLSVSPAKSHYYKTYREWPDKLKTEIYEDSLYTKLLSYTLWRGDKKKLVHWFANGPGPTIQIEGVSWDFGPIQFYKRIKGSRSVSNLGIKNLDLNGGSYFVIEVKAKDATFHLYINTTTYLVEYSMSPDGSSYSRYSDYQIIDDLGFNMSCYTVKDGHILNGYHDKKIHLNYPIDKKVFDLPD